MSATLSRKDAIQIRIGDVPLEAKLDALCAALQAVRLAHRDTMSVRSWAALNRAEEAIGEATVHVNADRRLPWIER